MIEILGWIAVAAGLAALIYVMHLVDGYKAARQPLYLPPGEKNPLYRGPNGYYDPKKGWIVDGIFYAIILAVAIIFRNTEYFNLVLGLVCVGVAGGLYIRAKSDWKTFERNMEAQKAILAKLKSDPEGELPFSDVDLRGFGPNKLVWVFGTFYDFHVDPKLSTGTHYTTADDQRKNLAIIKPRLVKLSKMPESEWLQIDRSKKA